MKASQEIINLIKSNILYIKQKNVNQTTEFLRKFCKEIPPRPAGSEGIRKARDVIRSYLEELGINNVWTEEVPVNKWINGDSYLEILNNQSGNTKKISCYQVQFTPKGSVFGEIIEMNNENLKNHVDSFNINGKNKWVAMTAGNPISGGKFIPLSEKIKKIADLNPSGIIIVGSEKIKIPAVEVYLHKVKLKIPCVTISYYDGETIKKKLRKGRVNAKFNVNGYSVRASCENLIGRLDGSEKNNKKIILSAHLDGFWNSPGVFDNLAGVVTILEIIKLLKNIKDKFLRNLEFIFFTGEEIGFLGSKSYVEKHRDELDSIDYMINMDGILPSTAEGMIVMWSDKMKTYIDQVFNLLGTKICVKNQFCMSSDYLPFMLNGVGTSRPADFINSFPPWSHTDKDILKNIDIEWIVKNAKVYGSLVAYLLLDEKQLPVKKLTKGEVNQLLMKEKAVEYIENYGLL